MTVLQALLLLLFISLNIVMPLTVTCINDRWKYLHICKILYVSNHLWALPLYLISRNLHQFSDEQLSLWVATHAGISPVKQSIQRRSKTDVKPKQCCFILRFNNTAFHNLAFLSLLPSMCFKEIFLPTALTLIQTVSVGLDEVDNDLIWDLM